VKCEIEMMKITNRTKTSKGSKDRNKQWLHPPEALQGSHIAYLVKFLGNTEVDHPKGIHVVKEGIRKLKFNAQLKKSEGEKPPKIELTISIDGVAIQEPKSKKILHQYPLHRISYCADDKAEKKFFSFIAKESNEDKHNCFVFVSDKLAEEITLTIGQAFDLAFKRFKETSGRDLEMRKQMMVLQQRIQVIEQENETLKSRLTDLSLHVDKNALANFMQVNDISDLTAVEVHLNGEIPVEDIPMFNHVVPPVPPRTFDSPAKTESSAVEIGNLLGDLDFAPTAPAPNPQVGTKLEGLLLDDFDEISNRHRSKSSESNNSTNGVADTALSLPAPPKAPRAAVVPSVPPRTGNIAVPTSNGANKDLFGSEPFAPPSDTAQGDANGSPLPDPFGLGSFSPQELQSNINSLDKRISEMKAGFSKGLSIEDEDFTIDSLDPLKN